MSFAKTQCPVSRQEFRTSAKPLSVTLAGQPQVAVVKEFSTNSFGWYLTGKVMVEVNGVPVMCQVGMNVTVIGSKELPRETAAVAA